MQTRQGANGWWGLAVAVVLRAGQQALGQQVEPWATLKGHTGRVNSLAFSPDGRMLASAGDEGKVKLWEVLTGKERVTLRGHKGGAFAVAFAPVGGLLASGGEDRVVRLWDTRRRARCILERRGGHVTCLSFSPDGTALAVGGYKEIGVGQLRLWNVQSGKERLTLRGHAGGCVSSLCLSSDGRMLAGGDWAGVVTIWETASGKVRASLKGHCGLVFAVTLIRGNLAASGGEDGIVRLWELRTGKPRATLEGHTGWVSDLSGAGAVLASASHDFTVRLWDVATGNQLEIVRLGYQVCSVAFSPDGKLLAAGDEKGTIRLWSVPKLLAKKGTKEEPRPRLERTR